MPPWLLPLSNSFPPTTLGIGSGRFGKLGSAFTFGLGILGMTLGFGGNTFDGIPSFMLAMGSKPRSTIKGSPVEDCPDDSLELGLSIRTNRPYKSLVNDSMQMNATHKIFQLLSTHHTQAYTMAGQRLVLNIPTETLQSPHA